MLCLCGFPRCYSEKLPTLICVVLIYLVLKGKILPSIIVLKAFALVSPKSDPSFSHKDLASRMEDPPNIESRYPRTQGPGITQAGSIDRVPLFACQDGQLLSKAARQKPFWAAQPAYLKSPPPPIEARVKIAHNRLQYALNGQSRSIAAYPSTQLSPVHVLGRTAQTTDSGRRTLPSPEGYELAEDRYSALPHNLKTPSVRGLGLQMTRPISKYTLGTKVSEWDRLFLIPTYRI